MKNYGCAPVCWMMLNLYIQIFSLRPRELQHTQGPIRHDHTHTFRRSGVRYEPNTLPCQAARDARLLQADSRQLCRSVITEIHVLQPLVNWETSGSHSGVGEDSGLLGSDTVSLGQWFPTFRRFVMPSSSGSSSLRSFVTSRATPLTTHCPNLNTCWPR